MKTITLKAKFIFAYVLSLFLVLALLLIVFETSFRLTMDGHIREEIYAMQDALDESLTEVVNESAYLFARIKRSNDGTLLQTVDNAALSDERREEAFGSLIALAGVNREYFTDVIYLTEDRAFSLADEVSIAESQAQFLKDDPYDIVFVGVVQNSVVMGLCAPSDFNGIFLFCIAESRISEMCASSSGGEGYSFVMRSDGLVVSHPDGALVGKSIIYSDIYNVANAPEYKKDKIDGVRRIIVISASDMLNARYGFDSYVISVLDYAYYFGKMDATLMIVIGTAAGVFAIAAAFAIWRARKISRPISALSAAINGINEPTKQHMSVLDHDDELVQLERNYDAMMDRIYDLVEKNKEDMQRQRKLELDSLQMQINPHFLYNTLDAISWMAKIKGQPEIDRLVLNLAKFFRLSLHNGDKFISVREEVELVKSYLEIDKIRFPDRLTESIEVDEEIADCLVLKLILQPIVENCLKYAFPKKSRGKLRIKAYGSGDDILLEVEDNGVGFEVPEDILTRAPKKDGGYGLINVNQRIKLQYGEEYGLSVTSTVGKGTLVVARLKGSAVKGGNIDI